MEENVQPILKVFIPDFDEKWADQPLMQYVFLTLEEDTSYCFDMFKYSKENEDISSDFWLRIFIRSLFAQIEGSIFALKQHIYKRGIKEGYTFSNEQIAVITEMSPKIQSGLAVKERMKINLTSNLLFTFQLVSDMYSIPTIIDTNSHRWGNFKRLIDIRDRLMHPKENKDVQFSDDESFIVDAYKWWLEQWANVFSHLIILHKRPDNPEISP